MQRRLLLFLLFPAVLISGGWRLLEVPLRPLGYILQSAPTPTASSSIVISSPVSGQALQGTISIEGNTMIEGFQDAELSFSYFNNPTNTWFLISQSTEPVANGLLAQWDTTTLSDGVYTLRLAVMRNNGQQITTTVPGVRVRNYTPVETNTPTPLPPTSTITATPVPGDTPIPTYTDTPTATPVPPSATPLPSNPLQLSGHQVVINIGKGALTVVGLFALLGFYQMIRSLFRRK
jgi:hypothetical protein